MSKSKKDNEEWWDLENDPYYAKDSDVVTITVDNDTLSFDDIVVDSIDLGKSFTVPDTITMGDVTFDSAVTTSSTNRWDIYTTDNYQFPWSQEGTMWKDYMPTISEVEEMCKEYPGLEKAYENFKTIYKMVEQDYKGKKDDEDPF